MIPNNTHEIELLDAQVAKISEEAAMILEKARLLKFKRNSLTLIYQLPPELLSRIFHFHAKHTIQVNYEFQGGDLVNFMHVCQHWRKVAVETPDIWSTPDFRRPKWAQEMVARSKTTPLTLVTSNLAGESHADGKVESAVEVLRREHHRVHELDMAFGDHSNPYTPIEKWLSQISDIEAPRLRRLCLEIRPGRRSLTFPFLPEFFFRERCPRLKYVTLRHFDLDKSWNSFILRNLTSLCLGISISSSDAYPYWNRGAPLGLDKLLFILRNCPDLELLQLQSCCKVAEEHSVSSLTPVKLPRLRRFEVTETPSMSRALVELISFPNLESISLSFISLRRASDQDQLDLRRMMEQLFHSSSSLSESHLMKPRSLFCYTSSASHKNVAALKFYTSYEPYRNPDSLDSNASIAIRFAVEKHGFSALEPKNFFPILYESMSTVIAAAPLLKLEYACAQFTDPLCRLQTELITSRLGHLHTLKEFIVAGKETYVSVVDALGRQTGPECQTGISFASLQKISFLLVGVSQDPSTFQTRLDPESPGFQSATKWYGTQFGAEHWLLANLRLRKSAAGTAGIEKIIIDQAPVHLEDLRELVGDVEILD
ncbi:hypothetical protein V5O48_009311 [Marasmius crinis-equi]|uniref:F-box domain-containing protein n=1 Tax=Marasmius crinis-equi TaxID=585013 RepID=A0ABR3FBG0_9AGAR